MPEHSARLTGRPPEFQWEADGIVAAAGLVDSVGRPIGSLSDLLLERDRPADGGRGTTLRAISEELAGLGCHKWHITSIRYMIRRFRAEKSKEVSR